MDFKETLVARLRGPHVNPLLICGSGKEFDEIRRLQNLCFEAADEIERLQKSVQTRD
jgi:hypothetical protein